MFNPSFRKGMSVTPQVFRNITEEKMAAPNNAYYVLTQAHAGLPNSVLFDTAFAGKTTDDLLEGSTNLYYTDARVGAYVSPLFVPYTGATKNVDIGGYDLLAYGVSSDTIISANTLTIGTGSITDTTGAISFSNENLSTTGTLSAGATTVSSLITNEISPASTLNINAQSGGVVIKLTNTPTLTIEESGGGHPRLKSSTGQIEFNLDNCTAMGDVSAANFSTSGTINANGGSIKSSTGAISFDDENLLTTGVVKIGLAPGETWTYGGGAKLQVRHKEDGTALIYPIQICAGGDTSQCGGYIQWQYPLGTMVWMAGASSSNNFTIRQDNDSYRLLLNHISGDYGSTYLCSDGSKGHVDINGSGKARDGGGGFRVYAGQSTSPALWFRVYSSSNSPLPTAGSTMVWDLDVGSDNILIRQSKTPASAGASGTAGTICWDSDYIYVCVATNTWKRAAISSW